MKIKAVIFDMDGLMIDSERVYLSALKEVAASYGCDEDSDIFLQCIGRNRVDTMKMFVEEFGTDFPAEEMCIKTRERFYEMQSNGDVHLKKGLHEVLQLVEKRNIPRCLVSSSLRSAIEKNLETHNLKKHFPHYIGGDEVENGKPNPEGYLKAVSLLGYSPDNCVVLEDSEPGIKAAHNAGTIPIMIPDILKPSDEVRKIAHKVFPSLVEATDYLNQLL